MLSSQSCWPRHGLQPHSATVLPSGSFQLFLCSCSTCCVPAPPIFRAQDRVLQPCSPGVVHSWPRQPSSSQAPRELLPLPTWSESPRDGDCVLLTVSNPEHQVVPQMIAGEQGPGLSRGRGPGLGQDVREGLSSPGQAHSMGPNSLLLPAQLTLEWIQDSPPDCPLSQIPARQLPPQDSRSLRPVFLT